MHLQKSFSLGLLSACMAISLGLLPVKVAAQGIPPVSTVTLQVVPGANGQESVLTPKGMVVPLPGPGVNANAVQIYLGAQGGAWYVDKFNQNVDLTAALERFRSMSGQAPYQGQMPQYAPAPPLQNGNSGNAAAAGMAAMGGAMAGAAMAGAYTNAPYGTPVYYPHGGTPYYMNASGVPVNVAHPYAGADSAAYYDAHAANLEKQQAYYESLQHANSAQYQNWHKYAGENPFVNQQAYAATAGAAAGAYHANQQGLYNPAAAGAAAGAYHANEQGFNNPAAAGAAAGAYHENQEGFKNPAAAGAAAGAYHANEQGFNNPAAAGAAAGAHHENEQGLDHAAAAGAAAGESGGRRGRFRRGGSDGQAAADEAKAGGRFGRGGAAEQGGRFGRGESAGADAARGAGADGARDAADGGGRRGRLRR